MTFQETPCAKAQGSTVALGSQESRVKLQSVGNQAWNWRQKASPDNENTYGHPEVNTCDSAG